MYNMSYKRDASRECCLVVRTRRTRFAPHDAICAYLFKKSGYLPEQLSPSLPSPPLETGLAYLQWRTTLSSSLLAFIPFSQQNVLWGFFVPFVQILQRKPK